MLEITPDLALPENELELETSRSSGPGGQNVNKLETRVTVRLDVEGSPTLDQALSEEKRERLLERLDSRLSRAGVLRVTSQKHRSQSANREEARQRLAEILRVALDEPEERKPTRVPKAVHRRRLQDKRRRSEVKKLRGRPDRE